MFYYLNIIYTTNFLPSDKFTRFSVVPISDGKKAISVPKPITIPAYRDKNSIKTAAAAKAKSRYRHRRRALDTAYWTEQRRWTTKQLNFNRNVPVTGRGQAILSPFATSSVSYFSPIDLEYQEDIFHITSTLPTSKHA